MKIGKYVRTLETRKKMSIAKKEFFKTHPHPIGMLGKTSPFKGKTYEERYGIERAMEIRRKDSLSHIGKPSYIRTPEINRKNVLAHKGLPGPMTGRHFSKEHKRKLGESKKRDKNPAWRGGINKLPYGFEFDKDLKEQIRRRDNFRCQQCFRHQDELFTRSGKKDNLEIHHIDYDKFNNNPKNLVSLCPACHAQTGFDRNDWTRYFQDKIIADGKLQL